MDLLFLHVPLAGILELDCLRGVLVLCSGEAGISCTSGGLSDSSSLCSSSPAVSAPLWLLPAPHFSFPCSQVGVHFL